MQSRTLISEVKIKSHDESRILLGSFKPGQAPNGFSLHIVPETEADCVTSSVVFLDKRDGRQNIIMNIENFGTKTIKAQVWPI